MGLIDDENLEPISGRRKHRAFAQFAGIIDAADGSVLTFAFFALDDVADSSKQALDTITAAAYRCGNNLSNQ